MNQHTTHLKNELKIPQLILLKAIADARLETMKTKYINSKLKVYNLLKNK